MSQRRATEWALLPGELQTYTTHIHLDHAFLWGDAPCSRGKGRRHLDPKTVNSPGAARQVHLEAHSGEVLQVSFCACCDLGIAKVGVGRG